MIAVRPRKRLPLDQLQPYLLPDTPLGQTAGPIVWRELFGNDQPVEIEVGFGKGLFLVTAATACPQVNFFGVEIVRKYQLYTATRLALRQLTNVRVACADARLLLRDRVAPSSVQAVHVYFPDPWWKKRHHKRRVFTTEFAASAAGILRPGGRLHVVTDVEEYFGIMTGIVGALPEYRPLPPPEPNAPRHDLDYLTNFERKFRKQGKSIFRAAYERV
jgi:tRNA (guanine-N7-)-methyltransferase